MDISDPYIAYCFDEVILYYLSLASDGMGGLDISRIKLGLRSSKDNKNMIDFIKNHS